jgi:hypothetical protein
MMDSDGQHYYGPAICPKCNLTVYHAEWVVFNSEAYHQSCFVCADCRRNLNSANAHRAQGKLLCKACFSKGYGMTGYGYGGAVTSLGGSHGGPGGKAEQPLTAQAHCYPQLQQMQQAVDAYDGYPGAGDQGYSNQPQMERRAPAWVDPNMLNNTIDTAGYTDAYDYQQMQRQQPFGRSLQRVPSGTSVAAMTGFNNNARVQAVQSYAGLQRPPVPPRTFVGAQQQSSAGYPGNVPGRGVYGPNAPGPVPSQRGPFRDHHDRFQQ